MLSGTPLQNNTTELWALLNFLDRSVFHSLDDFHNDFGTLTDADQIEKLNEKIRPYLLRRQKGDVEKVHTNSITRTLTLKPNQPEPEPCLQPEP